MIALATGVDQHSLLWRGNELRCGEICFTYKIRIRLRTNFLLGPSTQCRFHYNL